MRVNVRSFREQWLSGTFPPPKIKLRNDKNVVSKIHFLHEQILYMLCYSNPFWLPTYICIQRTNFLRLADRRHLSDNLLV